MRPLLRPSVAGLALALLLTACGSGQAARTPSVSTVATGLAVPWDIAFLPGGSALITERPGRVRLLGADGRLQPAPVAAIPVVTGGENGLLGLTLDPAFTRNRFVYVFLTTPGGNVVRRYRFAGGRLAGGR